MLDSPSAFTIKAGAVRAIPIFELLSEDDITAVLPFLQKRTYAAGEEVLGAGARVAQLCMITDGRVILLTTTPRGHKVVVEELGPGQFFGEAILLGDGCVNAEVVEAQSECSIICVRREALLKCIKNNPVAGAIISQSLVHRLRQVRSNVARLTFEAEYIRVINILLERAHEEGGHWTMKSTADFIAALTATSVKTVKDVLRDLVARGLVTRGHGCIVIRNRALLVDYCMRARAFMDAAGRRVPRGRL